MKIRPLVPTEVQAFVYLQRQIFKETQNFLLSGEEDCPSLSPDFESKDWLHLVSVEKGALLGYLSFQRGAFERCRHRGHFSMGILKAHWGRGVGKALLAELETWAVANGVLRIELSVLESNPRALMLYLTTGYHVEGRKCFAARMDAGFVDGFWLAKILPHPSIPLQRQRLSLSALAMTETELKAMAVAAHMGLSNHPNHG